MPTHLDAPFRIIIWTVDELAAFLLPFILLFFMMNAPIVAVVVGVAMVIGLRKLKGEEGHYFLAHLAYWYLPPLIRYRVTPPSHIRFLLG